MGGCVVVVEVDMTLIGWGGEAGGLRPIQLCLCMLRHHVVYQLCVVCGCARVCRMRNEAGQA